MSAQITDRYSLKLNFLSLPAFLLKSDYCAHAFSLSDFVFFPRTVITPPHIASELFVFLL